MMTAQALVVLVAYLLSVCGGSAAFFDDYYVDRDGCWMNGSLYQQNEALPQPPDDPCSFCMCDRLSEQPMCAINSCADPGCVDPIIIGSCCPSCPNGQNCLIHGQVVDAGDFVSRSAKSHHALERCEEVCTCVARGIYGTMVSCSRRCQRHGCDINNQAVAEGHNVSTVVEESERMRCTETCICRAHGHVQCFVSCRILDVSVIVPVEERPGERQSENVPDRIRRAFKLMALMDEGEGPPPVIPE